MPIRVECPNPKCKKHLQAPDTHAGKKARCPGCGHIITIPDPDTVLIEAGADPLLGNRLGPLQIKEKLGKGGMGVVYLATNTSLDRLVAVKVLPDELVRDDPTFLERFNREARMAAKLTHPNAVIIYSVGEDRGRHYIEMEFVQGMNLRHVIQKQGHMELKEASRIIADAARALSAAHKQGIVHRDIKPDNIMLTEEGEVKVADFGLARVAATDSSITISGQVIGTPLYMSPEQGQGKPTDGRTDIYSLGATYYHAVTGMVPFTADTPLQVMMKHVQEPVGWPADAENIPWDIRAIIEKMMAKNPADRYQDCDEVIHEIEEYFKPRAVVAQAVEEAVPVGTAVAITAAPKNAYVLSAQDLAAIESAGRQIRHRTPTRPKKMGADLPSGLSPFSSISKWLLPVVGMGLVVGVIVIAVAIKGRGGREHAQTSLGVAPGVETTKGAKKEEPGWKEPEGPQPYEQYTADVEKASRPSEMKPDAEGFVPLFNGKDLTGWEGDTKVWLVEDGMLIGRSPGLRFLSYLTTTKTYSDFILRFRVRLVGGKGNSGMLFRSERQASNKSSGYEAEIKTSPGRLRSPGRGDNVLAQPRPTGGQVVKGEDWNDYEVKAMGDRIAVAINGVQTIEYTEKDPNIPRTGVIGARVVNGAPMEVQFKDIRIKELGKEATKPPETQIAQCGELIFEDNFDRQDLQDWKSTRGDVQTANGALVMVDNRGDNFPNVVLQLEPPPADLVVALAFAKTEGNPYLWVTISFGPEEKRRVDFGITEKLECALRGGTLVKPNPPLLCSKPCDPKWREFKVVFEKLGKTLALNVNGVRMTADCPDPPSQARHLVVTVYQGTIALDYIRVWKAEPKRRADVSAPGPYDETYVATSATHEKIPHPLSRKTHQLRFKGQIYEAPEGMVFVPAGPFIMGDNTIPDASPAHEVNVEAFFIDKYEVTNAQYMEFVKATGHPMPEHFQNNGGKIPEGRENHPVTGVSWEDAKAYCDWCGKRLPTEAEWEKAASWNPGEKVKRKYPWGNEPPESGPARANWAGTWGYKPESMDPRVWQEQWQAGEERTKLLASGGATTPVGTFFEGISPYRCFDMAGNVREYVQDYFGRYPGNTTIPEKDLVDEHGQKERILRGGFWALTSDHLQCAKRDAVISDKTTVKGGNGFRCAADYPWKPDEQKGLRTEGRAEDDSSRRGAESAEKGKKETTDERRLAQIEEKRKAETTKQPEIQNQQSNPAYPRDQNYDDAFVREVAALPPDQQVERVMARLKELNPGFDGEEEHKVQDGQVVELTIAGRKAVAIRDLSPIRALSHLQKLRCSGHGEGMGRFVKAGFSDLSVLRGLPLIKLEIQASHVSDLSPLRGMPLHELRFHHTPVQDLSPLRGTPLTWLDMNCTPLSDLTPLEGMSLTYLDCSTTKVTDLSPLKGMPLTTLRLHNSKMLKDLSPLKGLPLQTLTCMPDVAAMPGNRDILRSISTLETINGSPVAEFWKDVDAGNMTKAGGTIEEEEQAGGVDDAFVREIAALSPEEQVKRVVTKLKELNPGYDGNETHKIENAQVTNFHISALGVTDISPIRTLTGLRTLHCCGSDKEGNNSDLADLSPLAGLQLSELNFCRTKVQDLSPLQGMPLRRLLMRNTPVSDLTPLKGMALEYLACDHTRIKDLSPLRGMPLKTLIFPPQWAKQATDCDVLRSLTTLERVNNLSVVEFWRRVEAGEAPVGWHGRK